MPLGFVYWVSCVIVGVPDGAQNDDPEIHEDLPGADHRFAGDCELVTVALVGGLVDILDELSVPAFCGILVCVNDAQDL